MRRFAALIASLTVLIVAGCSGGDEPTAEDDKFMNDLATAAAKNPAAAPTSKESRMKATGN